MKKEKKHSARILNKKSNIPKWHKPILEERLLEFKKNPRAGIDWDTFVKELKKI